MITKLQTNFNIQQIADSGQCFRIRPVDGEEMTYTAISQHHVLKLTQDQDRVTFFCPENDLPFWENYFDLQTDYDAMIRSICPDDHYLKDAARFGYGIRILRQDPWEMIVTFLISQQKTIPAIRALVDSLSAHYGSKVILTDGETAYAFPTPCQLSAASLEDLKALKLGYRAKYIKKICEDACSGALDLNHLSHMDYAEAMAYLQSFYGIGEKVANCICLFGLHHIDAFPVDTWIRKILLTHYAPGSRCAETTPASRICEALVQEHFSRYKGYAGVMQQYIFYYERFR